MNDTVNETANDIRPRPIDHRSIEHRPVGIDDPYKRLPTERFPRDPRPGDRVGVNFRADLARTARVVLSSPDATAAVDATPLGGGLWTADLGTVGPGEHVYTIEADPGDPGAGRSDPFHFTVGRWREASAVDAVEVGPGGARLHLRAVDGPFGAVALSFPRPGECRIEFADPAPALPGGLPCSGARDGDSLVLTGPGIEVHVDLAALELRAARPGAPGEARASLAWRALVGSSGLDEAGVALRADPDEPLYGLGERFDGADRRGRVYDVRVYEEYKEQGSRTYLPVPFVVSPRGWGAWLDAEEPSVFDLRGPGPRLSLARLPEDGPRLALHLFVAEGAYGVSAAFVAAQGGLAVPPKWALGPWMSSNDWNRQSRAEEVVRRTVAEDVPATVLVLEAWSDESTFYIWNDAEYEPKPGAEAPRLADFRFGGRWPDPKAFVDECHTHGIRVVLWQIPVQKHVPEAHAQHHADEAHMIGRGYGVRNADGSPYRCRGWWFTDGLVLDFTNPEARDWWFAKRAYLFDELGIDGMKTDGGEHLWGRDLRVHDGRRGLQMVNAYANAYVGAYHDFVQARTGGEGLTFSRAGYTGAGRFPAHWAGDENSTWNALKASIQAGLSAGLSGVSFWTWDIGGFSGDIPTAELYLRSVAFGALCPIMQYHSEWNPAVENRDRTPWNIAERTGDPLALEAYRRFAKLRMRLLDHLHGEATAMSAENLPLMRHPHLVHPEAADFLAGDPHAYLLGRDLLVCPVVEKGALAREVRLPPGVWADAWTGERFAGPRALLAPAPLDRLPVYVRADSPRREEVLAAFAAF